MGRWIVEEGGVGWGHVRALGLVCGGEGKRGAHNVRYACPSKSNTPTAACARKLPVRHS